MVGASSWSRGALRLVSPDWLVEFGRLSCPMRGTFMVALSIGMRTTRSSSISSLLFLFFQECLCWCNANSGVAGSTCFFYTTAVID